MHKHPRWKGLVKLYRFALPCFLLLPSGYSNVRQVPLGSKRIIEEESGHMPVSDAGITKYGNERVTLGEVMGQKRQIAWCGEA